ncbi:HlyD family efflux transporter periplasmic adaptor subunit [Bosea sp. BK604]|uniref:HlyD family secretion protein n=1 Tax=Bosea sp. BK604 TaxID=2512180 RepID=UPI0010483D5D|nr:HlyD family efflux transporter periplasmic adaptor subunit [Bosea sp. BK604]TCR67371.1 biotin/lipoyl-binding protein [Bosea sp. BK604]
MIGRRSPILTYGLPLVAFVSLLGAAFSIAGKGGGRPAIEPRPEPSAPGISRVSISRNAPMALIGAAGLVEPSSQEIKIGTDISGTVARVFVAPGAVVKRGEPLFALNASRAEATLLQRHGEVAAAQARLALARSRVAGLRAEVQVAHTAVESAQAEKDEAMDLVRVAGVLNAGATITSREITRRNNMLRQANAKLSEARARLTVATANLALFDEAGGPAASIAVELAVVEQAQRALKLAEADLELHSVRAPDDGMVLQVNLRPGEFAQAGALSQGLLILGRTDPLHLRIDIDEADITRYQPGAPALAYERGRERRRASLSFVRVEPLVVPKRSLSGQALERVDTRVMQVIYALEAEDLSVRIGQQLDVFIEVGQFEGRTMNVAESSFKAEGGEKVRD